MLNTSDVRKGQILPTKYRCIPDMTQDAAMQCNNVGGNDFRSNVAKYTSHITQDVITNEGWQCVIHWPSF